MVLHYRNQEWFKKLDDGVMEKLKKNQKNVALDLDELAKYDKEFNKKFTPKQLQSLITGLAKKV
jgi:hypothetical protein